MFIGRDRELAALDVALGARRPSVILLRGPGGVGKTALLREGLRGRPHIYHVASPLGGSRHLEELRAALALWPLDPVSGGPEGSQVRRRPRLPPDTPEKRWGSLLAEVEERTADGDRSDRPPVVLAIDDVGHLLDAHGAFPGALAALLRRLESRERAFHVVLCGSSSAPLDRLVASESPLFEWLGTPIDLGGLTFRAAGEFCSSFSPVDRLRAWAILGGSPSVLSLLDPSRSLDENVKALILEPGAPLAKAPVTTLRAELQSIGRYASVLHAVAVGARSWGEILKDAREIPSSAQLAPYVRRLVQMRLLREVRSLDADPGSRNRRYEIADPFMRFWFGLVLPHRDRLELGETAGVWEDEIVPALGRYLSRLFPEICRQFVREHAAELVGVQAREVGAIWGGREGSEIQVAGALEGGAVLFGTAEWREDEMPPGTLDELGTAMRRTRYGVARMVRHRVLFAPAGFAPGLRAKPAAEEHLHLVDIDRIMGSG